MLLASLRAEFVSCVQSSNPHKTHHFESSYIFALSIQIYIYTFDNNLDEKIHISILSVCYNRPLNMFTGIHIVVGSSRLPSRQQTHDIADQQILPTAIVCAIYLGIDLIGDNGFHQGTTADSCLIHYVAEWIIL